MLVEYTYLHPRSLAIVREPPIPEQGDAVQVMGAEDGAVYDGMIQAVTELVFKSDHEPAAYLLYIDVPDGQPRIHELVEHLSKGGDLALRLVSDGASA